MKVLIVSDTHRRDENLERVLEREKPIDCLIHLGDVEGSEDYIREIAGCETHIVSGNNDFFCDLPREEEFMLRGYKVLLTHGHYYYVTVDLHEIRKMAVNRGIDIVMFGHTHRPLLEKSEETFLLNPGSLSYPRQSGRKPSYIVMETDAEGKMQFEVRFL
ncbi:metallophosphoesterase [Lachnospiraceae bacterium 46-15]